MPGPRGVFLGLATLDVVHYVEHAPGPDEKVTSLDHAIAAGGPAANAAVTFAALGGAATLLTAIGPDAAGGLVRADLAAHGVGLVDLAPAGAFRTPASAITVSIATAERSIVGSDGARARVMIDDDALRTALRAADVLLLDGHYPQAALRAAHLAREAGVPVVLDVGRWKPVFADLMPFTTHAVCSQDVRPPGLGGAPAAASMAALRELGADVVVVTQGAGPVLVSGPTCAIALPVPQVEAVDTLGAGDAFHGAYAFEVAISAHSPRGPSIRRRDPCVAIDDDLPRRAVQRGIEVAALRVRRRGPRSWLARLGPR